jgi:hypothetical protein
MKSSYDSISGIYSYKKDGQWFFSVCPPDQVASKRVDGKWYFIELCVGGGGGDSDVSKIYVDSQDQKLQANIDKCFSDSKDYADSIVADYALVSYVDEQIAAIEIPEDQDLSLYAKTTDMTDGDAATLTDSKDYTDTAVAAIEIPEDQDLSLYAKTTDVTAGDAATLTDSKSYTDEQIGGLDISVDLSEYASQEWVLDQGFVTEQPITDGDAATLDAANKYTDEQIGAIEFPEGVDLSTYAEKTYVDGADQAVQRFATTADDAVLNAAKKYTDDSLGTIPEVSIDVDKEYVDTQDATKIGNTGEQTLPTATWKMRAKKVDGSGNYSYISIQDDTLKLYHVADPTADAHGMSRGFADARYQFPQRQIVFKCDQYVKCSTNPFPAPGEFCGLNNSSQGSSTSPNPYFGNWNVGIRVDPAKLLNPEGNQLSDMERYTFEGTVTIIDDTGKLYFKGNVHSVSRTNNNPYVDINFGSRVPAFGTGSYNDSEKYIILVEGLEAIQPATVNIPED